MGDGVPTIEVKSGYGLGIKTQMKMRRFAPQLAEVEGVDVKTTFIGAHALPPAFTGACGQVHRFRVHGISASCVTQSSGWCSRCVS